MKKERKNKAVYNGRVTQTSNFLKPYILANYVVYILGTYVFYIATKKKKEEENRNNAHTAPTTRSLEHSLEAPSGRVLDAPAKHHSIL